MIPRILKSLSYLIASVLALSSLAGAEDRALIVSLSIYSNPEYNLTGIEQDVMLMQDVLGKLNFKPGQIKVVRDQQATHAGIVGAIESWLIAGTKPGDRAVLYFNGHGEQLPDQNGDEADGCDEALVPYDFNNPIRDDDVQSLTARIPAQELLVILDSCYSGTATRIRTPVGLQKQIKLFNRTSVVCNQAVNDARTRGPSDSDPLVLDPGRPLIELTASAANEVAWGSVSASKPGSMFTVALHEQVMAINRMVTFEQLKNAVTQRLATSSTAAGVPPSHPQLQGPANWLTQPVVNFGALAGPVPAPQPAVQPGPDFVTAIAQLSAFPVSVYSDQNNYAIGQEARFTVTSAKAGYLNLIEVDARGEVTVLFPNAFDSGNKVQANMPFTMTTRPFKIIIGGPAGTSQFLAIVSEEPLNLYQTLITDAPGSRTSTGFARTINGTQRQNVLRRIRATAFAESGFIPRGIGLWKISIY